ncbi:MAG: hypothetical protein Kow00121_25460 [Elainellaceae cyanobacterium]
MPEQNYVQQDLLFNLKNTSPLREQVTQPEFNSEEAGLSQALPNCEQPQPEELLDQSSLQTVLDMLCVITSAEELALLEHLTDAQKRQVWAETPEAIRQQLKQIRSTTQTSTVKEHSIEKGVNAPEAESSNQLNFTIGDWVVLNARPKLTTPELIAIWEIIEIQADYARIQTQTLGTRTYPIGWMIPYPKP